MARTTRTRYPSAQKRPLRTALATAGRPFQAATVDGRLQGRALVLARSVWLAVAALTVAAYVAGVWVGIDRFRAPCLIQRLGYSSRTHHFGGLCQAGHVPLSVARAFTALHLSIGFYGAYTLALDVLFAVGFAAVAALLFWRRSSDPLALFVSLTLLLFGLASFESGLVTGGLPAVYPGWRLPVEMLQFLGAAAIGILGVVFPDGRFVPRWSVVVAAAWALWWLPTYFFSGSPFDFFTWPGIAFLGSFGVLMSAVCVAQVYRYRRVSTRAQRRQTKWVVSGIVGAGVGYLVARLVGYVYLSPSLTSPAAVLADLADGTLIFGSLLLLPVTLGIAVLRYHLFEIDIIIRRTLIYSIVTGTLATVYAISSIVLQAGFVAVTGQGSALAVVGSTLAIAALFAPVRSRVQATVDRRFFRRKYDAVRTLQAFGETLRSEVDLIQLSSQLVAVVQQTMQPSQSSLWLVQRRTSQDKPTINARPHPSYAAEAEVARVPEPVPLPSRFGTPDSPKPT